MNAFFISFPTFWRNFPTPVFSSDFPLILSDIGSDWLVNFYFGGGGVLI